MQQAPAPTRHIISILVENEPGVLARVAGLFSGRGFNIDELSVAKSLDPTVSRVTLVTVGDDQIAEQIVKQLNKLVCVIKVVDFQDVSHVERELALIKVSASERTRNEILNVVNIFRARVVDVNPQSYVVEVTGDEDKIHALLELLRPFGIKELVRTGLIAIGRASKTPSTKLERVAGGDGEEGAKKSPAVAT